LFWLGHPPSRFSKIYKFFPYHIPTHNVTLCEHEGLGTRLREPRDIFARNLYIKLNKMASFSGGKLLNTLQQIVCEVHGKVKKVDVALPSTDIKEGKMILYRLGHSSSFSIGIQTANQKFVSPINVSL